MSRLKIGIPTEDRTLEAFLGYAPSNNRFAVGAVH